MARRVSGGEENHEWEELKGKKNDGETAQRNESDGGRQCEGLKNESMIEFRWLGVEDAFYLCF